MKDQSSFVSSTASTSPAASIFSESLSQVSKKIVSNYPIKITITAPTCLTRRTIVFPYVFFLDN